MNIQKIQNDLNAAGFNVGTADGVIGPKFYQGLMDYAIGHKGGPGPSVTQLGLAAVSDFAKYQINTPLRLAHFIAQSAEETQYYQFLTELGGPSYFTKYDGRHDLGNTVAGDGYKFRGRGLFQITGRYNYQLYTTRLGIDLVDNPDRASEPEIAMLTACMFWSSHNLNSFADVDDCKSITTRINGGTNGLQVRQDLTTKLKTLLGA
jgi:putative chitinase